MHASHEFQQVSADVINSGWRDENPIWRATPRNDKTFFSGLCRSTSKHTAYDNVSCRARGDAKFRP